MEVDYIQLGENINSQNMHKLYIIIIENINSQNNNRNLLQSFIHAIAHSKHSRLAALPALFFFQ